MEHFFVNTLRNLDAPINSLHLPNGTDTEESDLISLDNEMNLVHWGINPLSKLQSLKKQDLFGKRKPNCLCLLLFNNQFYYWADGLIYDSQGNIFLADCSPFIRPIVFRNNIYYPTKQDDSILNIYSSNHETSKIKFSRMIVDLCHNEDESVYALDDSGTIYSISNKAKILWKESISVAGVCTISALYDDLIIGTASGYLYHYEQHELSETRKFEFGIRKVFVYRQTVYVAYSDRVLMLDVNDLDHLYKELTYTPATCFLGLSLSEKVRTVDPITKSSYYPNVAIGCETGIIRIVR